MAAAQESAKTTILCKDNESITIDRSALERSRLFQSLPSVPDSLALPFSGLDFQAWQAFQTDARKSFVECVAAMKVADFLQDESSTAASKAANRHLYACQKRSRVQKVPPALSSEDIYALRTLSPDLAHSIFRARQPPDGVGFWLRKLPKTCHTLAVTSAVQDSCLELGWACTDHLETIFHVLSSEGIQLEKLSVTGVGFRRSGEEDTLADGIQHQVKLRCLEFDNVMPSVVPPTLTALTRLRVTNMQTVEYTASDLHMLTGLLELELAGVYVYDFKHTCLQLPHLSALTKLHFAGEFTNTSLPLHMGTEACPFPQGMASCTTLEDLSLCFGAAQFEEGWIEESDDDDGILPWNESMVGELGKLSRLTRLKLAHQVGHPLLEQVWPKLRQLLHLSFKELRSWGDPSALHHLTELQSFHSYASDIGCRMAASTTTAILRALPSTTLTALSLSDHIVPAHVGTLLASFTNLKVICLKNTNLPATALPQFTALTALQHLHLHSSSASLSADRTCDLLRALPTCMKHLAIINWRFSADAPPLLAGLTCLEHLEIADGKLGGDEVAAALATHISTLSRLQMFSLGLGGRCSGRAATQLLDSLRSLPRLDSACLDHIANRLQQFMRD